MTPIHARTLYTVLEETARSQPEAIALHQPIGKGKYAEFTWNQYLQAAGEIACGLRALGVRKGEIVALHSETRAEFYFADVGIMTAGAISGALYTSYPLPDQIRNLRASKPRFLFVENVKTMRAFLDAPGGQALELQFILLTGEDPGAIELARLREMGRRLLETDPQALDKLREEVKLEDHAVLYMTSGATGEPKMGLVTHGNIVSNIDMAPVVLPLTPHDSTVVFLPSAHIAQRVVLEWVPIQTGCAVWFSESLAKLPGELKEIRPTFFLAPPRVWERVFASIHAEVRKKSGLQQRIFHGALGIGAEASRLRQQGKPVPGWMNAALKLADRLVFRKIRARLGGRMRIAASGAAPLGKELAEFYGAIGLPLIEGYGLTEAGVVSLNPLSAPRFGSIGKPLPHTELKLADDGELLIRSPCVFAGYFNDPESTAAVLDNGWLSTGDIAEFDADGYLYITGRKKELIVSSNGKKIYPARIESLFKTDPLINQVLLIGDKLPYVTALFTVNVTAAQALKGMESYRGRPPEEIAIAAPVAAEIDKAVKRVNRQLPGFEQIRRFRLIERDFTIESGEVTPTMKVRRGRVLENYRHLISELYLGREEMQ